MATTARKSLVPPQGNRRIDVVDFAPSREVSQKCPNDILAKGIVLKIKGYLKLSWSTGTPILKTSAFEALVSSIKLTYGNQVAKDIRPVLLKQLQKQLNGTQAVPWMKANASSLGAGAKNQDIQLDGLTTGQTLAFSEVVYLPIENVRTIDPSDNILDFGKPQRVNLSFTFRTLADIRDPSGTDTGFAVDSANSSVQIDGYYVTSNDRSLASHEIYQQTSTEFQYTGPATALDKDIKQNGRLMGMLIEFVKGANELPCTVDECEKIFLSIKSGDVVIKNRHSVFEINQENHAKEQTYGLPQNMAYVKFLDNNLHESAIDMDAVDSLYLNTTLDSSLDFAGNGYYKVKVHFEILQNIKL